MDEAKKTRNSDASQKPQKIKKNGPKIARGAPTQQRVMANWGVLGGLVPWAGALFACGSYKQRDNETKNKNKRQKTREKGTRNKKQKQEMI